MESCGGDFATIERSDCCGNGCAQCVLDVKQKQSAKINKTGKKNIISNYQKFKLRCKKPYAELHDVLELHFDCCEIAADYILDIPAGHHIMMRAPIDVAASVETKLLLRPYSPFSVNNLKMEFKILVNLQPQGQMTNYIKNLHEGEEVEFRGPIGTYEHQVDYNGAKIMVIITQGIAIAPTMPIIEEILNNDDDMCRILHLSCFQDFQHIYFRDRLRDFNKYWNYKGHIYLSHQLCDSSICREAGSCNDQCEHFISGLRYKESIYPNRLCKEKMQDLWCDVNENYLKTFVICGTRTFQNDMLDAIKQLEINIKENIFLL